MSTINNNPSDCNVGYITSGETTVPEEEIPITNNMGVYCVNNKTYTGEITGGELEHQHYHNEFYAIGNPDNEIKYDHSIGSLENPDEEAVNEGEEWVQLANESQDETINKLIDDGHSKEMKFMLTEDDDTDNEGGSGG